MITKKILALKDFTLKTTAGKDYRLTVDQVEHVTFGSSQEFRQLLAFGNFVEAELSADVEKPILVLHPPVSPVAANPDMEVLEVQTHVFLPESDLECGTLNVIEFHKRARAKD